MSRPPALPEPVVPATSARPAVAAGTDGAYAFFALACALTWVLAAPLARAILLHRVPSPTAVACAGLSAFGPLLAALVLAGRRRQLGAVFGRFRTGVGWVVVALVMPAAAHVVANVLHVALGGHLDHWFYPPSAPEQVAALVVFPLGEEFGWRGFAHPRLVGRHGLVKGALLLGLGWALWHLMYSFNSSTGALDWLGLLWLGVELPLDSVIVGALFERSGRSMAVAIAFHAGAHLDNFQRAPRGDLRLQSLHVVAVLLIATITVRVLARDARNKPGG